jgi:Flp pilus assembly protein TadG
MRTRIKASALVELALIIPIFLILLSGVIELSVLLYDKTVITAASREGVRYGVVLRSGGFADEEAVITFTEDYCANNLISFDGTAVSVTADASNSPPQSGDTLTVTVTFQYTGLLLFALINMGQQVTLTESATGSYE